MGRGREEDRGRPVEPGEARRQGSDPDAVRINRGGDGQDQGAGRGGRQQASEERQGSRVRRTGAANGQSSGQQTPREQGSPLQTERGRTTIEDSAVQKIAGIAAREVDGVRAGGSPSQSVGGLLSNLPGVNGDSESRGVSVEVGEVEATVDLTLTVAYGLSIPQVSESVRRNVVNRVENLVGLRVVEVNITVDDVFFPEQEQQSQQQG